VRDALGASNHTATHHLAVLEAAGTSAPFKGLRIRRLQRRAPRSGLPFDVFDELVQDLLNLAALLAGPFLDPADELFVLAFGLVEVVVRQFAPALLDDAADLLPVAFNDLLGASLHRWTYPTTDA
jgi:hypothetical protein